MHAWVVMTSNPKQKKSKGVFHVMTKRVWRILKKKFHKDLVASSFGNVLKEYFFQ